MKETFEDKFRLGFLAIFVFVLVVGVVNKPIRYYTSDEQVTIQVNRRENVKNGDASKYLIFTDNEVFECTDTVWFWKFNSSDQYNQLQEGKRYRVRAVGYRVPFLSFYRNIIEVQEEKK